jgi:hypothetical protein
MKDYERLHEACVILDSYSKKQSKYNLSPQHDMIVLCFDVSPDNVSIEHMKELDKLRCLYGSEGWYMNISC